jgi:peptidylprolyl isomerase
MMRLSVLACSLALGVLAAAPASAQSADPANTIVMETTKGRIVIALRPDLAPKSAERLKQLSQDGFYNNAPFHRVIPGFMAQTGDGAKGDGTGGSKYPNLPAEFSQESFVRGTVGMARAQSPNSGNSQFFIVYANAPHLNGQYTVVGKVTSGMENVDKMKRGEPVRDPDRIVKMTVGAPGR